MREKSNREGGPATRRERGEKLGVRNGYVRGARRPREGPKSRSCDAADRGGASAFRNQALQQLSQKCFFVFRPSTGSTTTGGSLSAARNADAHLIIADTGHPDALLLSGTFSKKCG